MVFNVTSWKVTETACIFTTCYKFAHGILKILGNLHTKYMIYFNST